MTTLDIGLSSEARRASNNILNQVLSNESLLLIKTKKAHWNVVGPQFFTLHELLEEQYKQISEYVDKVAERVRQLGDRPVASAGEFLRRATLKEDVKSESATGLLLSLVDDHEHLIRELRGFVKSTDESVGDRGTSDFLVSVMQGHEKMAWILRSFMDGAAVQPAVSQPSRVSHAGQDA